MGDIVFFAKFIPFLAGVNLLGVSAYKSGLQWMLVLVEPVDKHFELPQALVLRFQLLHPRAACGVIYRHLPRLAKRKKYVEMESVALRL
jgi:hypothetical protein